MTAPGDYQNGAADQGRVKDVIADAAKNLFADDDGTGRPTTASTTAPCGQGQCQQPAGHGGAAVKYIQLAQPRFNDHGGNHGNGNCHRPVAEEWDRDQGYQEGYQTSIITLCTDSIVGYAVMKR